jgi:hypothetical protein
MILAKMKGMYHSTNFFLQKVESHPPNQTIKQSNNQTIKQSNNQTIKKTPPAPP